MEVGYRSISAIAALANFLTCVHLIARLHPDAAQFKMGEQGVLRVAKVKNHEVACRRAVKRCVDGIIRDAVNYLNNGSGARSKDGASKTIELLKASAFAGKDSAMANGCKVGGKALVH